MGTPTLIKPVFCRHLPYHDSVTSVPFWGLGSVPSHLCGICGRQSGSRTGFSLSTSNFPSQYLSTNTPHSSFHLSAMLHNLSSLLHCSVTHNGGYNQTEWTNDSHQHAAQGFLTAKAVSGYLHLLVDTACVEVSSKALGLLFKNLPGMLRDPQ